MLNTTTRTATSTATLTAMSAAGSDVVLLSQSSAGSFEGDGAVDWYDGGNQTIRFTVSETLAAVLSGYRCGIHVSTMRGHIMIM